jgi:DNA-binding MltR family transcriptional regulator
MKRKVPPIQNLAEESQALYDVLNNESDMACVLISVSYLDYALASLLKHFFIEGKTASKILEPPSGFLSAFASRYELAYCLGLIPKGLYQNLQIMGIIRNAFAHSHLMMSLDHLNIAGNIGKLTFPR